MRVVVDTNALVSRLLRAGSVPAQAVDKALKQAEVVVSEATMEELADVLSRKKWDRYVSVEDRQEFIRRLLQVVDMVSVLSEIDDCRDAKDNQFLALALDAGELRYRLTDRGARWLSEAVYPQDPAGWHERWLPSHLSACGIEG